MRYNPFPAKPARADQLFAWFVDALLTPPSASCPAAGGLSIASVE
jgi:hypothetical protein